MNRYDWALLFVLSIISQLIFADQVEYFCQDRETGERTFIKNNYKTYKMVDFFPFKRERVFLNAEINGTWNGNNFFVSGEDFYGKILSAKCYIEGNYMQPYGGIFYPGGYTFSHTAEEGMVYHAPSALFDDIENPM